MKKISRTAKIILCILIIAAMTTGCAGQKAPAGSDNSAAADTSKEVKSTPTPAASSPKYGGTLIVSQPGQQYESNYYPPTATNSAIMQNSRPCLEPLFEMASDGTLIPFLVKEYKVEENGKKYTFHLQENVKFHDGTVFNAEAAKWNMEQTKQENITTVFSMVDSFEVVDNYTIIINMSEPDLLFLNTLATSQASLMVSPAAVEKNGKTWAETNPVGTGPFKLERWEYNVEMVYVRNDDYWRTDKNGNKMPYLDGITFRFITEDVTVTNAFKKGEIDMVRGLSSAMIQELQNDYPVIVYDYPAYAFNLWFSSGVEGSIYQDNKVRQAVSYALDRQAIVNSMHGAEFSPTNQLSYQGSRLWNDKIEGYPYNPEKARQLLAEAGYPNGFETSIIIENSTQNSMLCQAIQAYLAQVGIKVNIDLADSARYAENVIFNSWGDGLAVIAYTYTPDELCSIRRMLHPKTSIFAHSINYPQKYHDLMDDMLSQPTMDDMINVFNDINKYLIDDQCLLCPIWVNSYAIAQNDYVHGTGSGFDGETQIRYWSPETIWLDK